MRQTRPTDRAVLDRLGLGGMEAELLESLADPSSAAYVAKLASLEGAPGLAIERTLSRLRASATARDLADIDSLTRSVWRWWDYAAPHGRRAIAPNAVASRGPATVDALASDASGHVRFEAVRALSSRTDGTEIAPLLLRLDDWVSVIRVAARKALAKRVVPAHAARWLDCIWLVDRLGRRSRAAGSTIADAVLALLTSPAAADAVAASFDSRDPYIRRRAYSFGLESLGDRAQPDRERILRRAVSCPDGSIRLAAVRALGRLPESEAALAMLPKARKDRYVAVRREAMRLTLERDPTRHWVEQALLDASSSIRDHGRALASSVGIDPLSFYRGAVSSTHVSPGAVAGLAESGTPDDALHVEHLLLSDEARLRAETVSALRRLAASEHVDDFVVLLDDTTRVRRAATRALEPRIDARIASRLEEQLPTLSTRKALASSISLIARQDAWDALAALLRLSVSDDDACAKIARTHVRRWLIRSSRAQSGPTTAQLAELRRSFRQVSDRFSPDEARELEFVLRASRPRG